jgi:type VI secretion system secreted protein VgrG
VTAVVPTPTPTPTPSCTDPSGDREGRQIATHDCDKHDAADRPVKDPKDTKPTVTPEPTPKATPKPTPKPTPRPTPTPKPKPAPTHRSENHGGDHQLGDQIYF